MAAHNRIKTMFPERQDGRRWIYLVGKKDGAIKVGRTETPQARLMTHRRDMREQFSWCHLFSPLKRDMAVTVEYRAKSRFAEMGRRVRKTEVFYDIGKEAAIAAVRAVIDEQFDFDERRREMTLRFQYASEAWEHFKASFPDVLTAEAE